MKSEYALHPQDSKSHANITRDNNSADSAPFKLTDLQQAYWLGEQDAFNLHTPGYFYLCFFTPQLDIAQLEAALLATIQTHSALCIDIHSDGTQTYAPAPKKIRVPLIDRTLMGPTAADENCPIAFNEQALLDERRANLDEFLPAIDNPVRFSCFADKVHGGYYVHFIFRLFSFDAQSAMLLVNELAGVYLGLRQPQKSALEFRDFITHRQAQQQTHAYQNSLQYWLQRIDSLPAAPDLPTVEHSKLPAKSTFKRLQNCLNAEQTATLFGQARLCGVTINALLCTAYNDIVQLWAKNNAFTLNLLISLRPAGKEGFDKVLGNFGNTLLLEVAAPNGSFSERAKSLQKQMYRDLAHAQISGVEIIRAMHKAGDNARAVPVVFASSIGVELGSDELTPKHLGWDLRRGALQTPQVWLDCQVYKGDNGLVINWDYADQVLLPGVIDEMFAAFNLHLHALLSAQFTPEKLLIPALPRDCLIARDKANNTAKHLPTGLMHDFFAQASKQFLTKPAIIAADTTLNYGQLWRLTTQLAARLRAAGVGANDLVAIVAERGWRQVTAAMAVVQSGGAYLPVASDLPSARKEYLIAQPKVKVVLIERALNVNVQVPEHVHVFILEDVLKGADFATATLDEIDQFNSLQTPDDLAYVIFTSGSTGQPKGVAIDHRGAVNTLQDVIARFNVTSNDRVIGISAFNFDLSVFDIFATLGSGATLVIPPHNATPDPQAWAQCVKDHQVTVWNTVPALLEMQIEYLGCDAAEFLASIKLVMLSGDWIPVSLPERFAAIVPDALMVGLGGATEASIWSNYFIIDTVDPSWKSIPYGWPLSNQRFYVLNQNLEPAPTWVSGDLYIGGVGLAKNYYSDPEKTAASFIYHPKSGERLYRTGDTGRYHPSGYIEFLGRNDTQVKIRGFRIELGEIDAALERCPGVRTGTSLVRKVGERDHQIVAFYAPEYSSLSESTIRQHLSSCLPDYMLPTVLIEIAQLPVTANGKVDRKALSSLAETIKISSKPKLLLNTTTEKKLAKIWQSLLNIDEPHADDNFFELGGTSLLAVRLLNAITQNFAKTLPLISLLRHGTIAAQAQLLDALTEAGQETLTRPPLVTLREGGNKILLLVHPVGGNILCYRSLVNLLPAEFTLLGLQSVGDGSERCIKAMATNYIQAVLGYTATQQPTAQLPAIYLLGWSMGGVLAHEMARQLEVLNKPVAQVIMLDSWMGACSERGKKKLHGADLIANFTKDFLHGQPLPEGFNTLNQLPAAQQIPAAIKLLKTANTAAGNLTQAEFVHLMHEHQANYNALINHQPGRVKARLLEFRASQTQAFPLLEPFSTHGLSNSTITPLEEDHFSIISDRALKSIIESAFKQIH